MEGAPLLGTFEQDELDSAQAQAEGEQLKDDQDQAMQDAGVSTSRKVNEFVNAVNGFSAVMSHDDAVALANQKSVAFVIPDELHQLETDSSPKFLELGARRGPWQTGYTGEDVVVGVIDSGIWPEHPSFEDDGSYGPSPIAPLDESAYSACDFGNSAHNPNDAPFTCNNKLLGARQVLTTYRTLTGAEDFEYDSARDDNGHGTHTASTAAGNADVDASIFGIDRGTVSGIAPRARVIAYKALGTLGGYGSDLAAAIDQAVFDGVDVINYSVGGGASLSGPDDIAFLFAADAGVFVATSASNSGPGPGTIGGPASVPWLTSVGASTQARTFEGSVSLSGKTVWQRPWFSESGFGDDGGSLQHRGWFGKWWKRIKGEEYSGASVTPGTSKLPIVDAADLGNELCLPETGFSEDVTDTIVLCLRGAIARVDKSLAVFEAGGAGMVLYNVNDTQSQVTDNHWVPSVHLNNTDGLAVKDYIASNENAKARINGGKYTKTQHSVMAAFSSRGSNTVAEDIIKPDVTAPGVNILAGNTPTPDSGAPGELFQSISGTSMSSPHVAGIFALIKQAHPDWSPAVAKSALMTTARQNVVKEDGSTKADPFDMGAGHIDPGGRIKRGSTFDPGLVYDAGFNEYLGFLCDADPAAFANPAATCAALDGLGIPITATNLNYPSIGASDVPGTITIQRTVTSVADRTRTFRANVKAPSGYDIEVSPSRIRLAPGESATFEVIITNKSAPVGEWRFGSLTWKGSGYEVYSPIAVRGSQLSSPGVVEATGTDGSTSFDVTFGYTGDYAAAPHGLVADAPVAADIGQDPDQTYPSADDAPGPAGGVNKHSFVVADAAYLRWELVIPGDDDLDLFLEDSSGTIIASSTNGGTDELIAMVLPGDDTYTMVVHGWAVPSAPLSYELSFWNVPLATGGSLSVDNAPTSATIGTSGTIDISWTGISPASMHYGAVSHSDADGLIGLTLVQVTP